MVTAFRLLRREDTSCTLDLVGDGPEHPDLPAIEGLRCYPSLPLHDLVERYRDCDVFAAPSTGQESFGIVLLEAMAAGKPIVCSDIEGYRHVAPPEGASFVPPREPHALAKELRAVLDDEPRRRKMAAFNLGYVRRFDWPVVAREVVREYQVTIENHRVRRGSPVHARETRIARAAPAAHVAAPARHASSRAGKDRAVGV